ncbi:MAG: Asp-tRNA(Asn)/Glu-tRNA(Gln) amidotransferase subunit GatB [Methanothrix sp.]|jgi:aspartyl/glutamyl-tRNA(Asn/Gln) amidotransferase subunit B (EC 6.3.5.-)|uniref:Aspartyl/glutamyl-tRNA(Asn/Gln) amidotransferase subunit B n=1 Tax=Methanothrix thermoacetophila (strain DSM 6194 / JCM 14653 / NBRC 101360 / PT) TaxID=349307 RepID=A0B5K1_METTP|nr:MULTISPECIES: Asp-tRNA(Asn)/Glu-tRNA(Gln) amidotransferase subunit GatB [Methanothrix]ABK13975.1 aspartyl/glutamyl-tRNA(Asn/Gln) amidotransferase subunit B [Methanothrix thermoacetophila PT]MBC7079848.1 Asp-tRNA(Asn)/Glu-tRNA(Gln) amidotransferase subunit GatB [Methanothrix sp.]NPU87999.1 Asp-tRNA(Asn)/Glu-tRNA(Gln) amidotransferase subunit GatB [Methanothrix sp.]
MDDVIIGLEIHVQLNKLRSKMFCGCSTGYHDAPPNTHTCPVCLGLPGSLPVINRRAVEFGIKVALALNCSIAEETMFYRKNYYYPDLPKGFQISQYDYPLATGGYVLIKGDDGQERRIRITRVHMEEDPGRLVHAGTIDRARYTLVDYNRCGMPLLEVVTEPDLRSPKEARQFLDKLRTILEYLDVFDGNLEGSLRVDSNISLAGGDRVEVKNISSHKGVEKALSYEITRQRNLKRRGIEVVQETRHYDELRGVTVSIRTKEEAHDYRYFPEMDLVPLRIADWVPRVRAELPELPDAKRERFREQYGISDDHAKSLTSEIKVADFYEWVAARSDPRLAAVWIADVLKGELNYRNLTIDSFKRESMLEIVRMLSDREITDEVAVTVIRTILDRGGSPRELVESMGLKRADDDYVVQAVREAIADSQEAVRDYLSGNTRAINYIVGQVMKRTKGRADPSVAHRLVREEIERQMC